MTDDAALDISLDDELSDIVRVGAVTVRGVTVGETTDSLRERARALGADRKARWAGKTSGQIEGVQETRRLYRAIGIDPTRHRPSSEALCRRILKDKGFPEVNSVVDEINLASLETLLSYGLYDLDKIVGPVVVRKGRSGESYAGIRKGEITIEGRFCLADDEGPFGNPSSDSLRTCTSPATRALLLVVFVPHDAGAERVHEGLDAACRNLSETGSPQLGARVLLP